MNDRIALDYMYLICLHNSTIWWYQLTHFNIVCVVKISINWNIDIAPFFPFHLIYNLSLNQSLELFLDGMQVAAGRYIRFTICPSSGQRQVLGHDTIIDGIDACLL